MASTFTFFASTDTSAPVLTGVAGSFVSLLDAIFAGYGSTTGLGWTTSFTAANKRVYRPTAGSRFLVRVVDDGSLTGGARDAFARGYESMSDIDTGTNPFPTVAQRSDANSAIRKSTTADSTARPWFAWGDGRTLYLSVQTGDSSTNVVTFAFGDYYSVVPSDLYNCFICAGYGTSTASALSAVAQGFGFVTLAASGLTTVTAQHYTTRKGSGLGGSEPMQKNAFSFGNSNGSSIVNGALPVPNGNDASIYFDRINVVDTTAGNFRGYLRGVYLPQHASSSFTILDTITGTAGALTRTVKAGPQEIGGLVRFFWESSATVDTNS